MSTFPSASGGSSRRISVDSHRGGVAPSAGKVRPSSRADQNQVGSVRSVRPAGRGQTWQKAPGDHLLPGADAVLHAKPERQLQGWDAHREISVGGAAFCPCRSSMRQIRHYAIGDQVGEINAVLRGHYAYYGVAGNLRCLVKVYRAVERYWKRMLCSRSWAGRRLTWEKSDPDQSKDTVTETKAAPPLPRSCRLLQCCKSPAEERSAGNPHATFCGNRRRATASGDPVGWETGRWPKAQATAPSPWTLRSCDITPPATYSCSPVTREPY